MKNYTVTMEVLFEATTREEAQEFAQQQADAMLDNGAHTVRATRVAEVAS